MNTTELEQLSIEVAKHHNTGKRYALKHGGCINHKIEKLYGVWQNMRQRCNLPTCRTYSAYGGRGIKVCIEWYDYSTFRSWALANGYKEGLTIDRKDVDGNYTPSNCRWVDWDTQFDNKRAKKHLYQGEYLTSRQLSKLFGIPTKLITARINTQGWSVEDAVSRKPNPGLSPFPYKKRILKARLAMGEIG